MQSLGDLRQYCERRIANTALNAGGHCQINWNWPAKGAGLRRSGRQLIGFLTQGRFSLTMPICEGKDFFRWIGGGIPCF